MPDEAPNEWVVPVLALRESVVFPDTLLPLTAGRKGSIAAVDACAASPEKLLCVVAQKDSQVEEPGPGDLHAVGTLCVVRRVQRSDASVEILVHGVERVRIGEYLHWQPFPQARVQRLDYPAEEGAEVEALLQDVVELTERLQQLLQPEGAPALQQLLKAPREAGWVPFFVVPLLGLATEAAQELLEAPTRAQALRVLRGALAHQVEVQEIRKKIAVEAAAEMGEQQRKRILRQQMRAIQKELQESSPEEEEVESLGGRIEEAGLPESVQEEARRVLDRLRQTSPQSPDWQMQRGWLELVLELPWNVTTEETVDLERARQILDEDHHDLEEVKERILEHLAVMKLNPTAAAPILCFVGPPGVGKTSLGQSIARALGRKFERMSLGGVHDEAELRGHRRTYVGAMPGRILQAIRRAGTRNPLLMLDEVDKLGHGFHGDPAAALLEVLDPSQNSSFQDHYLDLPFDLSKVFFITTANTLDTIPGPLRDRMEVLPLSGYSAEDKLAIARRYLLPQRVRAAGLTEEQLVLPDATLRSIIARYTREAGVRELDRSLARVVRKAARQFAEGRDRPLVVEPEALFEFLGAERHLPESARQLLEVGVAAGLAWTQAGGDVLYVEATLLPEGKDLRLTGSLGEVMRESAEAARSYLWSQARALGISRDLFLHSGVHVHIPAGAVPKDGPSAGITLATALASLYTGRPVAADTAMTGEITLTGRVLPVGGIKEKVLAAQRAGFRRVILPRPNEADLRTLPETVRKELEFVLVERMEEVLAAALAKTPAGEGIAAEAAAASSGAARGEAYP